MFTKLEFTDQLIQDHLHQLSNAAQKPNESIINVPRDPKAFRDFVEKKNDFIAPYS